MSTYTIDRTKLQSGREICPKCNKKGLGFAPHPHAFGYKNYDKASCRYCKARFTINPKDKDAEV